MDHNDDACSSWLSNIKNTLAHNMNMFTDSSLVVDNQLYKKFELSKKFLVLGAGVSGQACTKWLEENQKINQHHSRYRPLFFFFLLETTKLGITNNIA